MSDSTTALKEAGQRRIRMNRPVNGQMLKRLTEVGLIWLKANQQTVNALNVFPVPDGDTGTNMVLTMQSACDEIANTPERNVGKIAHQIAQGALMGARGNSGVILSQLWRGFARSLDTKETLIAADLVEALNEARDTAYKGVVRPVEGTILTVAKDLAAGCEAALKKSDSLVAILEAGVKAADQSVEHTPELLPVLKEAGVVDAGGKGLFFILEGMLRWINGQPLDGGAAVAQPLAALKLEETLEAIEPGQDWELVIDFRPHQALDLEDFYKNLEEMGTSIQIGEGDGMYRLHIHVPDEKRSQPWDYAMRLGTVTNIAIENLVAQMEEIERKKNGGDLQLMPVEADQIAVVAVAPGPGIARVFASLGVAGLVEGGQTMNPSTQQIIAAFENLPTNKVIVLPNNKNIIMAAEAAAELAVKEVKVIKSCTVPQGLAAMMRLAPDGDLEQVAADMVKAMEDVQTGEITTATRNVTIDGVKVKKGQVIGLHNGNLVLSSPDLEKACLELMEKMSLQDYELLTLFYGADVDKALVNKISDAIRAAYPEQEIEVQEGGQPHYHFICAVE